MRELVAPMETTRILDIGGGGGSATGFFVGGSLCVTLIEPDSRKVRLGSRRHPLIRFVRARGESLPFVDGAFERVTAVVSLHHASDVNRVVEEMYRVLSPDGRLVIHELYPGDLPGWISRILARRLHGSLPTFLAPEALRRLLESRTFVVDAVRDGARGYFVAATRPGMPHGRAGSEI